MDVQSKSTNEAIVDSAPDEQTREPAGDAELHGKRRREENCGDQVEEITGKV